MKQGAVHASHSSTPEVEQISPPPQPHQATDLRQAAGIYTPSIDGLPQIPDVAQERQADKPEDHRRQLPTAATPPPPHPGCA